MKNKSTTQRVTPENITDLKQNEIFVFGSNNKGEHQGGAAFIAYKKFGAQWGVGEGKTGQSYAIPTLDWEVDEFGHTKVSEKQLRSSVSSFVDYAKRNPDYNFFVTPVGCGIAGWKEETVAPMFAECRTMKNVYLPKSFLSIL